MQTSSADEWGGGHLQTEQASRGGRAVSVKPLDVYTNPFLSLSHKLTELPPRRGRLASTHFPLTHLLTSTKTIKEHVFRGVLRGHDVFLPLPAVWSLLGSNQREHRVRSLTGKGTNNSDPTAIEATSLDTNTGKWTGFQNMSRNHVNRHVIGMCLFLPSQSQGRSQNAYHADVTAA